MPFKTGSWGIQAKERSQRRLEYFNKGRKEVLEKFGNKCLRCGFTDWRALQIDHINGGGSKERYKMSSSKRNREILDDKTGKYQLLCANCNWIKKFEAKEEKKVR